MDTFSHILDTIHDAQYDFTTHATSSWETSANGYHTREGGSAYIDSSAQKTYKQSNSETC